MHQLFLFTTMSPGYRIEHQNEWHFVTFQVIDWVDIFTRKHYRDIVINSFDYCRKNKGLQLFAYVIMSNHIHAIMGSCTHNLSNIIRDFKKYTAVHILKEIPVISESRRDWMLKRFEFAAMKNKRSGDHQFWTHNNQPKIIYTREFLMQKLAYIHDNPVRAGLVEHAQDWLYSSCRNYLNMDSILEIDLLDI